MCDSTAHAGLTRGVKKKAPILLYRVACVQNGALLLFKSVSISVPNIILYYLAKKIGERWIFFLSLLTGPHV